MITKARADAIRTGLGNVEFRLGEIEHLPIADSVIDVVISNCGINLSPDKQAVFQEAFRVLLPGGRLAISDIVTTSPLSEAIVADLDAYTGCIAGAALIADLESMLSDAGFRDVSSERAAESRALLREWPLGQVDDYVAAASIRAIKPA
ncbi:MAG: methyltransferase domain-containing protein, partial [Acidimicrobiia bacterium]